MLSIRSTRAASWRSTPAGSFAKTSRNSCTRRSKRYSTAFVTSSAFVGKWWSCAPRDTPARCRSRAEPTSRGRSTVGFGRPRCSSTCRRRGSTGCRRAVTGCSSERASRSSPGAGRSWQPPPDLQDTLRFHARVVTASGDVGMFVDLPSLLIVLGGTAAVTLANYSPRDLAESLAGRELFRRWAMVSGGRVVRLVICGSARVHARGVAASHWAGIDLRRIRPEVR